MSHLYAITAALAGATDVTVIAEALAEQTLTAFEASRGAVVLRAQDDKPSRPSPGGDTSSAVIERWRRFPLDSTTPDRRCRAQERTGRPAQPRRRGSPDTRRLDRDQIPAASASIPLDVGDRAIGASHPQLRSTSGVHRWKTSSSCWAPRRKGAQALERARSEEVRRLAEARLTLLAAPAESSRSRSTIRRTLGAVVDLVVPQFADWASVELLEPDGSIQSLAVAHVDPEKVAFAKEFRRRRPPGPLVSEGVGHVISTGRAELVPEITEEMVNAIDDPETKELVGELQLRSGMIVPLRLGAGPSAP